MTYYRFKYNVAVVEKTAHSENRGFPDRLAYPFTGYKVIPADTLFTEKEMARVLKVYPELDGMERIPVETCNRNVWYVFGRRVTALSVDTLTLLCSPDGGTWVL